MHKNMEHTNLHKTHKSIFLIKDETLIITEGKYVLSFRALLLLSFLGKLSECSFLVIFHISTPYKNINIIQASSGCLL